MREIKFRAWHKVRPAMYWFELLWGNHNSGNGYIGMVPWGESQNGTSGRYRSGMTLVDPMDCEIMQFTGLKDKNGKEIYEGDILQYFYFDADRPDIKDTCRGVVGFFRGRYSAGAINGTGFNLYDIGYEGEVMCGFHGSGGGWCDYRINEIEIIGNKYENPELLK